MAIAEIVVLIAVAGLLYAALAPLRRRIERAILRWRAGGRRARVIPLVRRKDGTFAAGGEEEDD